MTSRTSRPAVWHIGGDDVHKRIPLLQALTARGFRVAAAGSEDAAQFRDNDIPYFRYPLHRKLAPLQDLRSCRALTALFRKHQPDIVHGFDPKPGIAAPLLGRRAGVRGRVRTITGLGFVMASESALAQALRPLYRGLQKRASSAAFTVFQNTDDRDYFLANGLVQNGRERVVLSSGVDIDALRSQRPAPDQLATLRTSLGLDSKLVVTMVSRIDENKGVREFTRAADLVTQHVANVAFLLVGPYASEGPDAERFVESLRRQPQSVLYLGPRDDIPAILSLSDLCVLPSYREGTPRVLIEAGAQQVPSITTDVPGCRDVVRDNWNGRLVPPKDAPALATAIIELLRNRDTRTVMGRRSYRYVKETFDLPYVADAYAEIYHHALAETG